ncbi:MULTISPECIES: sigma-70 family RNA polymerase sigma factor [Saccharopolyspora]|uniref:Sigma-70 family RNA polymerase sigma factor n=1 Tax=Saccharopolyspora cebuensis TaxID=418759 RepID=A0ABV4CLD0_9PSEU
MERGGFAERDDARITELALAAARGDRRALDAWVRSTQADVWRFTAHLTDLAAADDLTQDTYLRAVRSLPRFAGRSSSRTWLLSIARRVVADHLRRAPARAARADDVELAGPGFEGVVDLHLLLDGLAEDRREALVLTQVLGYTYAEAAEVCGCPIGTVRSRVARAREALIAACDDREPGLRRGPAL